MTDKIRKIKEWISNTQDGLMDAQGNFEYPEHEGAYNILCNLGTYIDSLQEEPVSVWHDANKEEPKIGKAFATIDSDGVMCAEYHVFEGGLTFKQIKEMDNIVKWAYAEDLIPKN